MSIWVRVRTALIGLPIVIIAISTVLGTCLLLLLTLLTALSEYQVGNLIVSILDYDSHHVTSCMCVDLGICNKASNTTSTGEGA